MLQMTETRQDQRARETLTARVATALANKKTTSETLAGLISECKDELPRFEFAAQTKRAAALAMLTDDQKANNLRREAEDLFFEHARRAACLEQLQERIKTVRTEEAKRDKNLVARYDEAEKVRDKLIRQLPTVEKYMTELAAFLTELHANNVALSEMAKLPLPKGRTEYLAPAESARPGYATAGDNRWHHSLTKLSFVPAFEYGKPPLFKGHW